MTIDFLDFEKIPQLSKRDIAYQMNDKALRAFYQYDFEYSAFKKIIEDRRNHPINREILVKQLKADYQSIEHSQQVSTNIDLLRSEDTFTVITAHQPSLFTGPLYFILKICSAIHLAKKLSNDLKGINVVPVFILGAEDHDFEEINHTYIFNKKIEWNKENPAGSVGRMQLDGLDEAMTELFQILGSSPLAEELKNTISYAKENVKTYGDFTFKLVNKLFEKYGLIVSNFDNKAFKSQFIPLIKQEIIGQFSKPHILRTQEELSKVGFSNQAFARDINFFYLEDQTRARIEQKGEKYYVLGTEKSFTKDEIELEIQEHPERFSPNVIMRPLFQELIMPNLAYIGGGGELAYWMERKSQFEEVNIFFPMLIRRNSALWISKGDQKSLKKLELEAKDLLKPTDQLIKEYALNKSSYQIDFSHSIKNIESAYETILEQAIAIDGSLKGRVQAIKTNHLKDINKLQQRLVKTIKQNQETETNKVKKIKEQLFPGESLQERKTNFMQFYLSNGHHMFDTLIDICNPFERRFLFIEE